MKSMKKKLILFIRGGGGNACSDLVALITHKLTQSQTCKWSVNSSLSATVARGRKCAAVKFLWPSKVYRMLHFQIVIKRIRAKYPNFVLALDPKVFRLGGSFLESDPPFMSERDDIMKPLKKYP